MKMIYLMRLDLNQMLERSASLFSNHLNLKCIRFKSGAVYDGEWIGNMRDGFGVQTWKDGARYEGEWK